MEVLELRECLYVRTNGISNGALGYDCPGIETTGFASYLCTLYGRSAAIQLHIPAFLDARRVTS